jgi:uncharacterized membrane protein YkgB
MNFLIKMLTRMGLLKDDLDYHLMRASMVLIFALFGYQKWFEYEAQVLIPYISHGPLIFWLYPAFGIRGATFFLGVAEWLFGLLLFLGFWNKKLGILGALAHALRLLWRRPVLNCRKEEILSTLNRKVRSSLEPQGKSARP